MIVWTNAAALDATLLDPTDGLQDVTVVKQTRDPRQQELHVDYEVALGWSGRVAWLAFGVAALMGLIALRRRASLLGPKGH